MRLNCAILVPFSVTSSNGIAIQKVSREVNDNIISISQGEYTLVSEIGFRDEDRSDAKYQERLVDLLPTGYRFTFVSRESVRAEI